MCHCMDQLGSVSLTAIHALTPVLNKSAGADDVAEQGAIALVWLVVEVWVPVPIAAGYLWPVLRLCGAYVLYAVEEQPLLGIGLLAILRVGHTIEPHGLLSANVCRIQVGEVEAGSIARIRTGPLHRLTRPQVSKRAQKSRGQEVKGVQRPS